jgi:hypothetical protein
MTICFGLNKCLYFAPNITRVTGKARKTLGAKKKYLDDFSLKFLQ